MTALGRTARHVSAFQAVVPFRRMYPCRKDIVGRHGVFRCYSTASDGSRTDEVLRTLSENGQVSIIVVDGTRLVQEVRSIIFTLKCHIGASLSCAMTWMYTT